MMPYRLRNIDINKECWVCSGKEGGVTRKIALWECSVSLKNKHFYQRIKGWCELRRWACVGAFSMACRDWHTFVPSAMMALRRSREKQSGAKWSVVYVCANQRRADNIRPALTVLWSTETGAQIKLTPTLSRRTVRDQATSFFPLINRYQG